MENKGKKTTGHQNKKPVDKARTYSKNNEKSRGKKECSTNTAAKKYGDKKFTNKKHTTSKSDNPSPEEILGTHKLEAWSIKWDKAPGAKGKKNQDNRFREDIQKNQTKTIKGNNKELCPYTGQCGGCYYQGTSYEEQLKIKQKEVKTLLEPYGKVEKIIGMDSPLHYRNKIHSAFGRLRNGTIISGVYEPNSHRIVNIDECMIEDELGQKIIRSIRDMIKSFKIKTYDEDTGYGLLRHVLVRRGFQSGEVMVVLVLGSPILPSKNNFVKALRKLHPEITTVILNINDRKTSMVLGNKETTIYGKGYIEDTLCGLTFRISPKSFYQVNPLQTEKLYQIAMDYAGLTGKERVIDAYSGIGTIGIIAADKAKEVISVELNKDAVKDAIINAKRNEIKNITFYQKDAGEFLVSMAEQDEKADVVFMDPPRSGSDEAFLSSVVKLAPKRLVYISCNPETQETDLNYLTNRGGYVVEKIQPVDMFPFTVHVETVCCLQRVNM